jgi:hypothetical protein
MNNITTYLTKRIKKIKIKKKEIFLLKKNRYGFILVLIFQYVILSNLVRTCNKVGFFFLLTTNKVEMVISVT